MKLICPYCDANVPGADVNVQTMTAVCKACDHVFTLEPQALITKPEKRKPVTTPKGYTLDAGEESLVIVRNVRASMDDEERASAFLFALLAAAMAVLSVVFGGISLTDLEVRLIMLLSLPVALLVTAGFSYIAALDFCNRVTYQMDRDALRVNQGPLPWTNISLPTADIARVYLEATAGSTIHRKTVTVELHDGTIKEIGTFSRPQARFMLHHIRRYLTYLNHAEPDIARLSDDVMDDDEDEIIMQAVECIGKAARL